MNYIETFLIFSFTNLQAKGNIDFVSVLKCAVILIY